MTRPLYILSFRQRDELGTLAADAGWPVVATRRAAEAARRFTTCGASVAVIDLRGAWDEGAAVVAELAGPVAARGASLIALVSRGDVARLDEVRAIGATHFLASPFADEEFRQTLRFAEARAERRSGAAREPAAVVPAEVDKAGFLGRDLARALAADEIDILFQPQVEMASGRIVGVEALMRWRHPKLGELGAEQLLDAADRSEAGLALSAHVLTRALALAAAWPAELGDLRLAINITAEDLATADFAARLRAQVATSGFAADRLTLEITERGLIEEPERAATVLGELRAGGVRIAIDDFGTGYSSIAYLSQLPLDYLKLDRVLTQDIAGSARDRTVVRGVIGLAHSLGLAVIAEGVETTALRDLLAREGCAFWQGFLCAGPVDVDGLLRLVDDQADAAFAKPRAS